MTCLTEDYSKSEMSDNPFKPDETSSHLVDGAPAVFEEAEDPDPMEAESHLNWLCEL